MQPAATTTHRYAADGPTRYGRSRSIHPVHAIILAFVFPLFLGTLVADIAYWRSAEIQWSNFAQWLNAAGLFVGGFALLCALISMIHHRKAVARPALYFVILLASWIVGLVNAFAHSQDAWAVMPEALWWSSAAAALALVASWIGYTGFIGKETF